MSVRPKLVIILKTLSYPLLPLLLLLKALDRKLLFITQPLSCLTFQTVLGRCNALHNTIEPNHLLILISILIQASFIARSFWYCCPNLNEFWLKSIFHSKQFWDVGKNCKSQFNQIISNVKFLFSFHLEYEIITGDLSAMKIESLQFQLYHHFFFKNHQVAKEKYYFRPYLKPWLITLSLTYESGIKGNIDHNNFSTNIWTHGSKNL